MYLKRIFSYYPVELFRLFRELGVLSIHLRKTLHYRVPFSSFYFFKSKVLINSIFSLKLERLDFHQFSLLSRMKARSTQGQIILTKTQTGKKNPRNYLEWKSSKRSPLESSYVMQRHRPTVCVSYWEAWLGLHSNKMIEFHLMILKRLLVLLDGHKNAMR